MSNEAASAGHLLSTCPIPPAVWRMRCDPLIYFAGTDGGPIKIGRTKNMCARHKQLQCGSPKPVHVWAIARGNSLDEALYHERFAAHRLLGEWFTRCPEIEAEIARLAPSPQIERRGVGL